MPDYVVKTTFKGVDDTSKIFAAMERAAARYGGTAKVAMRGVGREADHASTALRNATKHGYNFGSIVKGILAANAIRGGIGMIGTGLQKTASDYLHFGDTMTGAVARFDEVDTRSAAFGTAIESMGKQVRKSMLGTRYSALDGAKALNELAKANYSSQQAMVILPNLTAFATAAQEDLAEATMSSNNVLNAFGMTSKDVQVQLKNHVLLNDQLTKTALMSTGNMSDLLETLKDAAPITKEFGAARETVLALTVALDNAGIKGTNATTAIKRAMTNLYASNMRAELELNGVHPFDAITGNPRKITVVLGELSAALDKLKASDRIPIIKNIFGMYGLGGSVKMMRELKAVAEYEEKLQPTAVEGLAERMAKAANSSTFAKLVMLGNAAIEKGFQVLDQYGGKAGKGFEWLSEKIMKFDVRPLITALDTSGRAAWTFYKIIEPFMPALPYLAGGFVAWKVAVAGWGATMAAIRLASKVKLLWDIGAALTAGLGPMGAMTTAMQALGGAIATAMAPIIAASGPIAALAAILGVSYATSSAMKSNGWGDNRSGDDLVAESKKPAGWRNDYSAISPNRQEAQARSTFGWNGVLTIAGAPAGSTLDTSTGSLPMLVNMGNNK